MTRRGVGVYVFVVLYFVIFVWFLGCFRMLQLLSVESGSLFLGFWFCDFYVALSCIRFSLVLCFMESYQLLIEVIS
jgi:hypothetical protein